jgi:adenylate cyclase
MGLEIERKFLVSNQSWRAQVARSQVLRQGYLCDTAGQASVRVRVQGDEARLNIKAAVIGRARAEYDYAIPLDDALQILDGLCVGRIEKTRHWLQHAGHTWEIDEFSGDNAGMVVAEIELDSHDEPFEAPEWLGPEVTDEQRYYNHALALNPYRHWGAG